METKQKLKIKGNWNDLKGKLKEKYANLTDNDLLFTEGKEDELLKRLEKKLGKKPEEISDIIDKLQLHPPKEKSQSAKDQPQSAKDQSHSPKEESPSAKGQTKKEKTHAV